LLGKKRTPIAAAATTESATKKASPDAVVALPPDVGVDVHDNDAEEDAKLTLW
jgi:hypothetical protein